MRDSNEDSRMDCDLLCMGVLERTPQAGGGNEPRAGVAAGRVTTLTRQPRRLGVCSVRYFNCQISMRLPARIGIKTRFRFASYPISAGLGTPVITFTSCPLSYADTVESAQLDTRIRVPATSTPSNPPAPLAMTFGALSPGFHASTDFAGPNATMMNRLPTGS